MNPEVAAADRSEEIRASARAWSRSGAIRDETLKEIQTLYPDDRVRVGPVFRSLLFLFTAFAGICAYFIAAMWIFPHSAAGILALLFGAAFAFSTEWQLNARRRRGGGTEAATSFLAVGFLYGGVMWALFEFFDLRYSDARPFQVAAVLILSLALARWGYSLYGAAAAVFFYLFLLRLPHDRILWIVVPLLVSYPLFRASESARFPPGYRTAAAAALVASVAALYLAVHIGSFDQFFLERSFTGSYRRFSDRIHSPWRWASIVSTAVVPALVLALGIVLRRRLFLLIGAALTAVSLVTLRWYIHVAPLWVVLTASGASLVAGVLILQKKMNSAPGREWAGFTADPPFNLPPGHANLELAAVATALTPAGPGEPKPPGPSGGGGQFGGGGAGGTF